MKIEERTKKDRETELTESVDKEIHEHCGCGEHHHEHTAKMKSRCVLEVNCMRH